MCVYRPLYTWLMHKVHVRNPAQAVPFGRVQVGCCNSRLIFITWYFVLLRLLCVIMHHAKIPTKFQFNLKDDVALEYNDSRLSRVLTLSNFMIMCRMVCSKLNSLRNSITLFWSYLCLFSQLLPLSSCYFMSVGVTDIWVKPNSKRKKMCYCTSSSNWLRILV